MKHRYLPTVGSPKDWTVAALPMEPVAHEYRDVFCGEILMPVFDDRAKVLAHRHVHHETCPCRTKKEK